MVKKNEYINCFPLLILIQKIAFELKDFIGDIANLIEKEL